MKPINDYEGLYEINEHGYIRNCKTERQLMGSINSYGYRVVTLVKGGKRKDCKLHRLLAMTFIPNPNNYLCVNHIDGNKLNNSIDNLEWCTHGMNNKHAREQLYIDFRSKPVVQATLEGIPIAIWRNSNIAAKVLGGNGTLIAACCRGSADSAYDFKWQYSNRLCESIDFL